MCFSSRQPYRIWRRPWKTLSRSMYLLQRGKTCSHSDDSDRSHRSGRSAAPFDRQHADGERMVRSGDFMQVAHIFQMVVFTLPHYAMGLPEFLALKHVRHRRIETNSINAHDFYATVQYVMHAFFRHARMISKVAFFKSFLR